MLKVVHRNYILTHFHLMNKTCNLTEAAFVCMVYGASEIYVMGHIGCFSSEHLQCHNCCSEKEGMLSGAEHWTNEAVSLSHIYSEDTGVF